jgi:hypothetical protein
MFNVSKPRRRENAQTVHQLRAIQSCHLVTQRDAVVIKAAITLCVTRQRSARARVAGMSSKLELQSRSAIEAYD